MAQNNSKNRKSESQEIFEQAVNAGRFAGNDVMLKPHVHKPGKI